MNKNKTVTKSKEVEKIETNLIALQMDSPKRKLHENEEERTEISATDHITKQARTSNRSRDGNYISLSFFMSFMKNLSFHNLQVSPLLFFSNFILLTHLLCRFNVSVRHRR